MGCLEEAVASYETAIVMKPGYELARFHRSLALLMRGEFQRAWPDYELRQLSEDNPSPPRSLPVWNGEPIADGALLVYGEQGIGDEIMFASCIPDVLQRCPHVVLACTAKLESLFRRSFPEVEVMTLEQARDSAAVPLASATRMIAIGSLPLHFRRDAAEFPTHRGYLHADPMLVAEYRERLAALGPELKIGISWRGGTDRSRRARRSVGLDRLQALLGLPGARFVNLQYDSGPADAALAPHLAEGSIVHWQEALDDYDRTAALVSSLDLVVSVCTAVIHLAGALGKPTLVMAPFSPEWRYGISGTGMPWYPSVRIFRQPADGEWSAVIQAIRERLKDWLRSAAAR
jgi:hypothetical protein